MKILDIDDLTKSFGDVKAVDGISFSVEKGALFAFLGLNGAGKSTTINIISTLLKKDGGKVFVAGTDLDADPQRVREKIGLVFQNSVLDPSLTVEANLLARASLYGIYGKKAKDRISELASLLGFSELTGRKYGKLSGGQRRRIDIARGLIHSPDILILDEPTVGQDYRNLKKLVSNINAWHRESGGTLICVTHDLRCAAALCDKAVLIKDGVAAETGGRELTERYFGIGENPERE